MDTTNPINTVNNEKLTAAEIGKLWATYMGNSMSKCVLSYFLRNVEDQEIRIVLESALRLSEQFTQTIRSIFTKEQIPIPIGFTEKDVNLDAPRLFEDEFYLHYLKYTGKAGISLYGSAVPLMVRLDVRNFFTDCLKSTIDFMNSVSDALVAKGFMIKPPYIPEPSNIDFVKKQNFLDGFWGDVRPLHSLEITHLYDVTQNNVVSKSVLIAFSQVAKFEQVKNYFVRGKEMITKHIEAFERELSKNDLPTHPLLGHLVTDSTVPPFSDKLMMYHKLDMFAMRIRAYGNALSFFSRHDLVVMLGRCLLEVGNYVEDGANILIDLGWFEQPPRAVDRDALASM